MASVYPFSASLETSILSGSSVTVWMCPLPVLLFLVIRLQGVVQSGFVFYVSVYFLVDLSFISFCSNILKEV